MRALIDAAFETGAVCEPMSEALAVEAEFEPAFARELWYEYPGTDEVLDILEGRAASIAECPDEERPSDLRIENVCSMIGELGGKYPDSLESYAERSPTSVEPTSEEIDRPTPAPGESSWNSRKNEPYVDDSPDAGRNDPCPCGSGRKYKKCCMRNE